MVELHIVTVAEHDTDVDFTVLSLDGPARSLFERFVGITAPETAVGLRRPDSRRLASGTPLTAQTVSIAMWKRQGSKVSSTAMTT